MRNLVHVKFILRGPFVNTDTGHSDWPSCRADRQTKIRVIRFLVMSSLHIVYDFGKTSQNIWRDFLNVSVIPLKYREGRVEEKIRVLEQLTRDLS